MRTLAAVVLTISVSSPLGAETAPIKGTLCFVSAAKSPSCHSAPGPVIKVAATESERSFVWSSSDDKSVVAGVLAPKAEEINVADKDLRALTSSAARYHQFQNPAGVSAPTQTAMQIEVAAAETTAASEPIVWPDELPQQIAAVRDLIAGNNGADRIWSVDSTARSFTKAKKKQVESVLDSLAALGLLVCFDTAAGKRWRSAS